MEDGQRVRVGVSTVLTCVLDNTMITALQLFTTDTVRASDWINSVSYTHLSVTKRKISILGRPALIRIGFFLRGFYKNRVLLQRRISFHVFFWLAC